MSSDSESEDEDDPRLMKLMLFNSAKKDKPAPTPEEVAAYLRELGGKDAIIYENLFVGRERYAMSFFFLMGVVCLNEKKALAPQIEEQLALFKACHPADDREQRSAQGTQRRPQGALGKRRRGRRTSGGLV